MQKLVLVITCLDTNEVLERWQFDIECDKSAKESRSAPPPSTSTFQKHPSQLFVLSSSGVQSKFQQMALMNHLPEPHTFILGFRTVESTGLTLSVKFSHLYNFSESLNHTCCTSKLFCVFLSAPREKSIKTIQDEIRSVIRQITATVTFLPLLDTPCK